MFVRTQQGPVKAVHACGRKFIYTKAYIICEQVWLRFCNEPHLYFRPFIAAEGTSEAQLRVALANLAASAVIYHCSMLGVSKRETVSCTFSKEQVRRRPSRLTRRMSAGAFCMKARTRKDALYPQDRLCLPGP